MRGRVGEAPVFADAPVQPFRAAFGGLDGQRLQAVRLQVLAADLPFFGLLADAGAGGDHEHRQVIAPAFLGVENVVAKAESIVSALAAEAEGVDGSCAAGREQVDGIAVPLGFEELPDGLDLHERAQLRA